MPRIIQPVVSPRGRVIVLTGATLWLIAAMVLSATPDGAIATPDDEVMIPTSGVPSTIETIAGTDELLYKPRLFADADGRVFVADRGTHRVIRLADDLSADVIYGREGAGPGEMQYPHDVAIDSEGNVFVVDLQLRRISKFAADGTFLRSVAAPQVASLLIDSNDELIVYPTPGTALMRRYGNDLEEGEELLEETDAMMHRSRLGVLMAMDRENRLYLFDQVDLQISVYDAEMKLLRQWTIDPPELRQTIARRLEVTQANNPGRNVRVSGVQAMALDPMGERIAFAYLVKPVPDDPEVKFTRVAWYSTEGDFLGSEDRRDNVSSNVLLADGTLLEGSAEAFHIFSRGPQPSRGSRGN